jgi:hypothetical protein
MDEELKQALIGLETRLDQRFDQRFVDLDKRLDQRFVDLDKRLDQRFVDLEKRLDQRFVDVETRFNRRLEERLEATETKLLTAFHNWAQTYEVRQRGTSAAVREFEERLGMIEERVAKIERGRSNGGAEKR